MQAIGRPLQWTPATSATSRSRPLSTTRISLDRIIPQLIPFVAGVLVCLIVNTYVPVISLGMRDLVYK